MSRRPTSARRAQLPVSSAQQARGWLLRLVMSGLLALIALVALPVASVPAAAVPAWRVLDAGGADTCGIGVDGSLWCWGDHGGLAGPSPSRVGADTNWASLSTSGAHTCAIRTDGTLWCWGFNEFGELGDGSMVGRVAPVQVGTSTSWAQVSAGLFFTCATRIEGTLWCWGRDNAGQLGNGPAAAPVAAPVQVGAATTWAQVSSGVEHVCATRSDGSLWCWGSGTGGQLGNGTTATRAVPARVGTATSWRQVAAGLSHTCAARTDGTAWCWGSNAQGQLGNGSLTDSTVPLQVGTATTWVSLSSGDQHTCATQVDASLWCWGAQGFGQVGNGRPAVAVPVPARVVAPGLWSGVTGGAEHTCGWSASGQGRCWGDNRSGQLGFGTTTWGSAAVPDPRPVPRPAPTTLPWASAATGGHHTCAIRADGTLWCWGQNTEGRLGVGDTRDRNRPTRAGAATSWTAVSAGTDHTCALRTDRTLWCWGDNSAGQLGDGTTANRTSPTRIGTAVTWASVSAGGHTTCATRIDGSLWCWGANGEGQLGIGTITNRFSPSRVGTGTTWKTVSASVNNTCATRTDGTLWCWGNNDNGQLGIGGNTFRSVTPAQVGTATTWADLAVGETATCATRTNGSLWCWGSNFAGQLAQPIDLTQRNTPLRIGAVTSWAHVAVSEARSVISSGNDDHVCATGTDGTLWCWGDNRYGQIGDGIGAVGVIRTPTRAGTATGWTTISTGADHSCAIRTTGDLSCWGDGTEGQLGSILPVGTHPIA